MVRLNCQLSPTVQKMTFLYEVSYSKHRSTEAHDDRIPPGMKVLSREATGDNELKVSMLVLSEMSNGKAVLDILNVFDVPNIKIERVNLQSSMLEKHFPQCDSLNSMDFSPLLPDDEEEEWNPDDEDEENEEEDDDLCFRIETDIASLKKAKKTAEKIEAILNLKSSVSCPSTLF